MKHLWDNVLDFYDEYWLELLMWLALAATTALIFAGLTGGTSSAVTRFADQTGYTVTGRVYQQALTPLHPGQTVGPIAAHRYGIPYLCTVTRGTDQGYLYTSRLDRALGDNTPAPTWAAACTLPHTNTPT